MHISNWIRAGLFGANDGILFIANLEIEET